MPVPLRVASCFSVSVAVDVRAADPFTNVTLTVFAAFGGGGATGVAVATVVGAAGRGAVAGTTAAGAGGGGGVTEPAPDSRGGGGGAVGNAGGGAVATAD